MGLNSFQSLLILLVMSVTVCLLFAHMSSTMKTQLTPGKVTQPSIAWNATQTEVSRHAKESTECFLVYAPHNKKIHLLLSDNVVVSTTGRIGC